MPSPSERDLLEFLTLYFDHVISTKQSVEGSLALMVRVMASVLAAEIGARALTEEAVPRTCEGYHRLLTEWTLEAMAAQHRPRYDDA